MSRGVRLSFSKKYCIFCPKIFFLYLDSVDPFEMQHYAAFHLGLHCLEKYSFRGFPVNKWAKMLLVTLQTRNLRNLHVM